jgi:predicted Zn-dependent protease
MAPEFGTAHLELGLVVLRRGDGAAAEGHLRDALALLQPYQVRLRADGLATLAELLVRLGRKDAEARTLAQQAIALRGEQVDYLATLARACEAAGDRNGALEAWDQVAAAPGAPPALREEAAARQKALRP